MRKKRDNIHRFFILIISLFLFLFIFPVSAQQLGDVDHNSSIDIVDSLLTAQYYVGLNPDGFDPGLADVDGNGLINIVDALLIAQYFVGLITEFPGPQPTPESEDLISNGEFDNGTTDWYYVSDTSTSGSMATVNNGDMSGPNALEVTLTEGGTLDWHVEVMQYIAVSRDTRYRIYFMAKAASPRTITVMIQQNHDPWTRFMEWSMTLTTSVESYGPFTLDSTVNDADARLSFGLGGNNGDVFLDNIKLIAEAQTPTTVPTPGPTPGPTIPVSGDAAAVRDWITDLTSGSSNRVLSGQFCSHGNEVVGDFDKYMTGLASQTGKYPAMISIDYEYAKIFSPSELEAANNVLIDYWNAGGLVSLNYTPRNPFTGGDTRDLDLYGGRLYDLVDSSTSVYTTWHNRLDVIADGLLHLKNAGVVVLWRPLQEGNGTWFWFGHNPGYIEVWRDMYEYFQAKGLDNLLWVYSVADGWDPAWIEPNYPGDSYVDFVGNNIYNDTLDQINYDLCLSFGKPLAISENGWQQDDAYGDNDNRIIINQIRENYPETRWFMNWHDWSTNNLHAIVSNQNAAALMDDPWVITRDEVNW
ncbi:MAG: carbohydrate binding domain-containing protein [Spirochaetales bacterium]|nr:carbohydrate binding domain-containing protein [Spirochaetales bacterium]